MPVKKEKLADRCCIDFHDLNKTCPKESSHYRISICWSMLLLVVLYSPSLKDSVVTTKLYGLFRCWEDWLPNTHRELSLHCHALRSKKCRSHLSTCDDCHLLWYSLGCLVDYVDDLKRVFIWCTKYNLRMNTLKCAIRGSSSCNSLSTRKALTSI